MGLIRHPPARARHPQRCEPASPCVLDSGRPWPPPHRRPRSSTSTAATTTWRRTTTTPSGASSFGETASGRCSASSRKAARPAPRAVRALARDRRRHRLLHAQPAAGGRRSARRPARDISPGMLATLERQRRASSGSRSRPPPATRARCRSRTRASTSCSATRCCTTCPTSTRAFAEFRRVLRARRHAVLRRRAVALRRPPRRACPSAPPCALAPLWRARARRAPRAPHAARRPSDDHALEGVVDVHAFVPGDLERARRGAGFERRARARRGAAGQLVRLVQPHARGHAPTRRTSRGLGSSTPTAATCCCRSVDRRLLEPRLPPRLFYNLMLAARKPGRLSRERRARAEATPGRTPPSPLDILRDKRAIVDTASARRVRHRQRVAGLQAAAGRCGRHPARDDDRAARCAAAGHERDGRPARDGLAVFIALRSGRAEGYFVPRMIYPWCWRSCSPSSVVIRRPLVGILIVARCIAPTRGGLRDRSVRRTFG